MPSDPAAVCLCGSPHADWDANGVRVCATCAANIVVASGSFVTPAAVPPPEWAVNIALEEFDKDRIDLGFVDPLARRLASVREGALREAAGAVIAHPAFVAKYPNDFANAILSLLHTPPSGGGAG